MGNQTIKVTPDEIDAVARKVVGPAYDDVQAALSTFRGTGVGADAFGGSPAGQHLGELHANVKTVFVKTVDGVTEDLDTFKDNLHKTAAGWRDTDESNAERAQTLATRLGGTSAAATNHAYQNSRDELGDKLRKHPSLDHPDHPTGAPDQPTGTGDDVPAGSGGDGAAPASAPADENAGTAGG